MANERTQRLVRTSTILVTLLLTALMLAQGTTQMIASSLLPLAPQEQTAAVRPAPPAPSLSDLSPRQLGEGILQRNIFDSTVGPMHFDEPVAAIAATETPTEGEPQAVVDPEGEPEACQSSLRLVAAMVVPRVPMLSFASIQSGNAAMLYRPGMTVEGHEIVGIREHRVFLRPPGRPLCQIAMFAPPPTNPPPQAAAPATGTVVDTGAAPSAEPPKVGGIPEDELNQGIQAVSDTQYNVSRSLLDKVLSNQSELMRAARVIPYEENGRTVGVKVYGIRRNSLLGKLGIQNGDVLRTINGFDLSSPDSALEAYTKLREMDQFNIAMIRRGQPRTMEYSVK
jgi:general secretion pathway protein C